MPFLYPAAFFFAVIDVVLSVIEPVEMTAISNFYIIKKIKKNIKKMKFSVDTKRGKLYIHFHRRTTV